MNNMANIVTSTLASAKAAASGASTANQKGDAFNPQDIIWALSLKYMTVLKNCKLETKYTFKRIIRQLVFQLQVMNECLVSKVMHEPKFGPSLT